MTHGQSLRQTLITEKMSSFAGYGYYILIIHYIYNIIYIYTLYISTAKTNSRIFHPSSRLEAERCHRRRPA